jgi:sortase A
MTLTDLRVDTDSRNQADHAWLQRNEPSATDVAVSAEGVPIAVPPPLGPRAQVARAAFVIVFALAFTMLLQLVLVSRLQHSARQERLFSSLRAQLAAGTAPIGPIDAEGDLLAIGTPIAHIVIPSIGVDEVIVEGTSASALLDGPGHRRNSPFPGQEGISFLFGRQASFGGPFKNISDLDQGDAITVTTGQGIFEYVVFGVRLEGDPIPPNPTGGASRLVLVSSDGTAFMPSSVVRVDADLVGQSAVAPPRPTIQLAANEEVLAGDTSTIGALALWLIVLIALGCALTWSWHRWGRAQTWIVFAPPLVLVGLAASAQVIRLLPNLL